MGNWSAPHDLFFWSVKVIGRGLELRAHHCEVTGF